MVSSLVALFVIVSVPIVLILISGISAYYFVIYRHTRSRRGPDSPDHTLPLQLPSSQKPESFHLDFVLPTLTFPPRARRRSTSLLPTFFRSSSSYVILPSPPFLPPAASEERQVADLHHAFADDDANSYLHYWPPTPSTASRISNEVFSAASSPANSAVLNYHQGMRQAALTALRRSGQTPSLDFSSLPTFDITSASPPNFGIGPSNTVPLPRPNSSSSSTMVSHTPSRSPYENPFANPPPQSAPAVPQQLDYFNCKPIPVPASQVEQHPYRCKVSSPLSPYSYTGRDQQPRSQLRSYWSPAVTPAPLQVLTRPSSPTGIIPPTPDDDPANLFPYISYESSPISTAVANPILPLPTPPPSSAPATRSFSSAAASNHLDIKIFFSAAQDLVKIRLPKSASLEDLQSKVAERMSGEWKDLHFARPGVNTQDPSHVATSDLVELNEEWQWRAWLKAATQVDRGSGSGKQRRIVLWAV